VKQLNKIAGHVLERIVNGVDAIPYGIRWICKQLGDLARQRFPEADRFQIGSLIGGYIYLRFFNPVIVTPDALNFIQTKPKGVMRRNLILVSICIEFF
jgi:Ras GTPase-activating-like protein IQGAP2/3